MLAAFAALFVVQTAPLVAQRRLWNDELFTYYYARLPTLGDVWSRLEEGAEQSPPFFYAVTRTAFDLLGVSQFSIRLPEAIGFLLAAVCLFHFVSRRSSALYGLLAMLYLLVSGAYLYAYEARPYGLMLAFAASALLCWQLASERHRYRTLALLGLAASLAAAVASHYYAILLLVPLSVGELVRTLCSRRPDLPVWLAFAAALLPVLAFLPLIEGASSYSSTFWAKPYWKGPLDFYRLLVGSAPTWVALVAVVLAALALARRRRRAARGRYAYPRVPLHELCALGALVVLPLFAVAVGKAFTDAYTHRYAIAAVLGLSALFSLAVSRLDTRAPILGAVLVCVLFAWSVERFTDRHRIVVEDDDYQSARLDFLGAHSERGLPLAVSSPHDYFQLAHYASREGGPRLVYLASPRMALRYVGSDTVDLGLLQLREFAPLDVRRYEEFLAKHPRFLVYRGSGAWSWLTSDLSARRRPMRVIARSGRDLVYEVGARAS